MSSSSAQATKSKSAVQLWITGVLTFLLFGAVCAYIAYDNRMISPNDTPAELAEHTRELKVVMISSFLGGGLLGGVFGAGMLYVVRRGNADNEPLEHEDEVG
jgi:uncharacterized membrane protein YfcA